MTTDTITLNQPTQLELDQAYEKYIDEGIARGRADVKAGRVDSYENVKKRILDKCLNR
ncbi:MAG: hypothetical protein HRU03_08670 [Nanoarchaeales archaeon]|nr:hypothetical protein [Nanoarchaeales archaeon]